jgi:hypothetical protein
MWSSMMYSQSHVMIITTRNIPNSYIISIAEELSGLMPKEKRKKKKIA